MTIRLKSNEETKKSYPFDFEVIYTYRLQDREAFNRTGISE